MHLGFSASAATTGFEDVKVPSTTAYASTMAGQVSAKKAAFFMAG